LYNALSQTDKLKIQENAKDLAALLSIWVTCHPKIRAMRIDPVAVLVATVLPHLPLHLSLLIGKIILFIFTVDDIADERLLSYMDFVQTSKVWDDIARYGNTVDLPSESGDLCVLLLEIRNELSKFPLFSSLSDLWARRLQLLTRAMAQEYENSLRYQVSGKETLPALDEYIESGIHSVGFPFWGTCVLILLNDPLTLANLDRLNEIILHTGAAIRLYNDVRTYEKEVKEANFNSITIELNLLKTKRPEPFHQQVFEQAQESILQLANQYAELSCQLADQKQTLSGQFEEMIQRIVAFHAFFYGSRQHSYDYHTISTSDTLLMVHGK
jgi:hypothetical protein